MLEPHELHPRLSRTAARRAGGFTLIELLVVIGIIVVLLAILVPVIGRMRTSSYTASTRNEIRQISSAIDLYYMDFKAYPGPISEPALKSTNTSTLYPNYTGAQSNCTSSENLVFGLLGGWEPSPGALAGGIYTPGSVGRGAASFNPIAQYATRSPTYGDMNGLLPQPWTNPIYSSLQVTTRTKPVFVDRFPVVVGNASPILYMRAHVNALGVSAMDMGGQINGVNVTQVQYDDGQLSPYNLNTSAGSFPINAATGAAYYPNADSYLGQTNAGANPVIPRQPNRYILISAGADGIFGTDDDIFN